MLREKKKTRFTVLCTLWSVLVLASCNSGANSTAGQAAREIEIKEASGVLRAQVVRPLSEQGNPWAGQYGEWDVWLRDNLRSYSEGLRMMEGSDPATGAWPVYIDAAGFMLPLQEAQRLREEYLAARTEKDGRSELAMTWAVGVANDQLRRQISQAAEDVVCRYYPQIPAWLLAEPPLRSIFLPNGNIATIGPLGSGNHDAPGDSKRHSHAGHDGDSAAGSQALGQAGFYLFSPDGQLLASSKYLSYPVVEELPGDPLSKYERENTPDGYLVFRDKASKQIVSVWDYDGTLLGNALPAGRRDRHFFRALHGYQLKSLSEAQLRSGNSLNLHSKSQVLASAAQR